MKQGQHRFHATDGRSIIPDGRGLFARGPADLARHAQARIRGLRAAMPPGLDWSGWTLDIHDASGRHVVFVDFEEGAYLDGTAHDLPSSAFRAEPQTAHSGPSENGALKRAEAMAARLPGTMALKIVADDETGEVESVTVLGQFGEVPDDFVDGLRGG